MTETERLRRLMVWQTRWRHFLAMYPEVLEVPLKLDREWLATKMAEKCIFHEEDDKNNG